MCSGLSRPSPPDNPSRGGAVDTVPPIILENELRNKRKHSIGFTDKQDRGYAQSASGYKVVRHSGESRNPEQVVT